MAMRNDGEDRFSIVTTLNGVQRFAFATKKPAQAGFFVGADAVSIELEVGGLDDFCPLLDFALQPVAEHFVEFRTQQPRQDVGGPSRRIRHDDVYRFRWIALRRRVAGGEQRATRAGRSDRECLDYRAAADDDPGPDRWAPRARLIQRVWRENPTFWCVPVLRFPRDRSRARCN